MLTLFSVISTLALMTVASAVSGNDATCDPQAWTTDPKDCSVYYRCIGDIYFKFRCPATDVVDPIDHRCVPKGSEADRCTQQKEEVEEKKQDVCKLGERKTHEEKCEKFYECSQAEDGSMSLVQSECTYPLVFDQTAHKCVHFEIAECGALHVPKDQCEYDANNCRSAHCVPCHIRYPSCRGLPDGMNAWSGRAWSPYYVVCNNERVMFQGECKKDKMTQIFNPDLMTCVEYKDSYFI